MEGLGIRTSPTRPITRNEMWGYFEKFIWLMKPETMSDLMASLFPQMMDAMPAGMVPMMKVA